MSTAFRSRLFGVKAFLLLLCLILVTSEKEIQSFISLTQYPGLKLQCSSPDMGQARCVKRCIEELSSWMQQRDSESKDSDKGDHSPMNESAIGAPTLLCREETMICATWKTPEVPDNSVSPFTYLLEQRRRNHRWKCLKATVRGTEIVENLQAKTEYQFRIRAITAAGQFGEARESQWISTLETNFTPSVVENATVTQHVANRQLRAQVAWVPASDKTCYHDVDLAWFTEADVHSMSTFVNSTINSFEVELTELLEYDKPYIINLRGRSRDGQRQSNNTKISFTALSCLQANNFNRNFCPPLAPRGVATRVEAVGDSPLRDITVTWDAVLGDPLEYVVQLVGQNASLNESVSGNETQVKFTSDGNFSVAAVSARNAVGFGPHTMAIINLASSDPPLSDASSSQEYNLILMVCTVMLAILGLAAAGGVIVYRQYTKRKRYEERCNYFQSLDEKLLATNVVIGVKPPIVLDDQWEVPQHRLLQLDVLGEGAFGVVRKGLLQGMHRELPLIEVAVKMLKDEASLEEMRQFQQEIEMMKSVGRHVHLVSIIGCCTHTTRQILITEFCALGDLQHFLRREYERMAEDKIIQVTDRITYAQLALASGCSSTVSLHNAAKPTLVVNQMYDIENDGGKIFSNGDHNVTSNDLLSFARQTTMGMEYLAHNRVVHRDLAARNVLLCSNKTIKISDFGLSRDVYEQNVYRKTCVEKLPIKWMALESLLHQVYTTQSDVWSFGVLLWEIVTLGGHPYPSTQTDRVFKLLLSGYRMECPNNCSAELYEIMKNCWEPKPKDRPTFAQLHAKFDALLEGSTYDQYLNLDIMVNNTTLTNSASTIEKQSNTGSTCSVDTRFG